MEQNSSGLPASLVKDLTGWLEKNEQCSPIADEDWLRPTVLAQRVGESLLQLKLLTKKTATINSKGLASYLEECLPCLNVDELKELYEEPSKFFCHMAPTRPRSFISFLFSNSKSEEKFSASDILLKNSELIAFFIEQTEGQSPFAITEIDYQLIKDTFDEKEDEEKGCGMPVRELFEEEY